MEYETSGSLDVGSGESNWLVAGRYELRLGLERVDAAGRFLRYAPAAQRIADGLPRGLRSLPARPVHRIVAVSVGGDRAWIPARDRQLVPSLIGLERRGDPEILAWVAAHGFVGVRGDPAEVSETTEEIREAARELAGCRRLLTALRASSGVELREIVRGFAPRLLPKGQLPEHALLSGVRLAREAGIRVKPGQRTRKGASTDIQALYVLGQLLADPVRRLVRVGLRLTGSDTDMRLRPLLAGSGPLGEAYVRLLSEASWPSISFEEGMPRMNWKGARRCGRCGATFRPRRRDQRWCGRRCRWAASKDSTPPRAASGAG